MNNIEEQRMARLQQERMQDKISAEQYVTELAQRAAGKLNQLIAQGHDTTAFGIAIILACLKDGVDIGLDFIVIGEIPILGQLPGIFISASLMYFLWGKGWFNTTKVKILLWGLGMFFDNLPFLVNDLPMTVLTVFMAWHIVRERAKKAEEDLGELSKKTQEELGAIEQEA
jgi:hypothetical protein